MGARLERARTGAVAVVFATMLVPLCMLAGLVIDYGWALQAKSQLDLAADAAAMAAARTAAYGYAAGQTSAVYIAEGTLAANQWWASQAGTVSEAKSFAATASVTQNGQTLTATLTYSASVYQVMPRLFGASANNVSAIANSSTASITVHAYATIDFLLDNTSSMMLPSTASDLLKLQTGEQAWLKTAANVTRVIPAGRRWRVGTAAPARIPRPACHSRRWAIIARSPATGRADRVRATRSTITASAGRPARPCDSTWCRVRPRPRSSRWKTSSR